MIFRYSTISDAHQCLRKYYEKHVAKSVKDEKSLDLEYGTAIHLAIKAHYSGLDARSVFKAYWEPLAKQSLSYSRYTHSELWELGEKHIDRFVKKYSDQFKPIEFEKQMSMKMGEQMYQGTLDMLCMYEGKVTLVDWKTSGYLYKMSKLTSSEQIYGYVALAEAELGVVVEQVMYFVFVKASGNIQTNIRLPLTREKLSQMVNNIQLMVSDLSTRTTWPMNPGCSRCVCGRDNLEVADESA